MAKNFPYKIFWNDFLNVASNITDFYSKTKNRNIHYLKTNLGIGGVHFATCINTVKANSWVEMCIEKKDSDENRAIFNDYLRNKKEIEKKFGSSLRWVDEESKNRCKIMSREFEFDTDNMHSWGDLHQNLIEQMVKLENSLKGNGIY